MTWDSWQEFIAMGGYGLYVWGSFGAAALAIGLELFSLVRRARAAAGSRRENG